MKLMILCFIVLVICLGFCCCWFFFFLDNSCFVFFFLNRWQCTSKDPSAQYCCRGHHWKGRWNHRPSTKRGWRPRQNVQSQWFLPRYYMDLLYHNVSDFNFYRSTCFIVEMHCYKFALIEAKIYMALDVLGRGIYL